MKRELSPSFISDLLTGSLTDVLGFIHEDNTLDLEIRDKFLNIYYRGGNILKITEVGAHSYQFEFDSNYLPTKNAGFIAPNSGSNWHQYFPMMKQAMDFYFTKHRKEEREYQQLVVRENNYSSIANGTDYFIIDIEYDNHAGARFDLVAVEWQSKASHRKLSKSLPPPKLVVIELKYGDGALSGNAGMNKHLEDFNEFIQDPKVVSDFKKEMLDLFHQKRELGLIPCLSPSENSNPIVQFEEIIELAFIIANHDPDSTKLQSELKDCGAIPVKFITSNFMGYGIYNESIFYLPEFFKRHTTQFYEI
jgi:hypothetical protein